MFALQSLTTTARAVALFREETFIFSMVQSLKKDTKPSIYMNLGHYVPRACSINFTLVYTFPKHKRVAMTPSKLHTAGIDPA